MDDADVAAEDTGRRRVDLSDGEVDTRDLGRSEEGEGSGLRQQRADLERFGALLSGRSLDWRDLGYGLSRVWATDRGSGVAFCGWVTSGVA
ncbi:hypothetical protein ACFPRL_15640 [Pseudoclavibacter helvolus]